MKNSTRRFTALAALGAILASVLLAGCAPGDAFAPSPWTGFPPTFSDPALGKYRAQYVADKARYDSNPAAFMGSVAPAKDCQLPPAAVEAFARDSYMPRLLYVTPTWNEVKATQQMETQAPLIDQASLRVLEGDCGAGALNGLATIHAKYVYILPQGRDQHIQVSEVELRETCSYVDNVRDGACARYQVQSTSMGWMQDRKLYFSQGVKPEPAVTFDYGSYAGGYEAGPGVSFETSELQDGTDTNKTHTRAAAGADSIRYEEYIGGGPAAVTFFRRASDRELHGPVRQGGLDVMCYDGGKRVMRLDCASE